MDDHWHYLDQLVRLEASQLIKARDEWHANKIDENSRRIVNRNQLPELKDQLGYRFRWSYSGVRT